ncbi:MAG: hypothetical protein LC685_00135 [Actinobacteria bacterium]|nr:hypothetical protein [Actinomycetota bacterium]
MTGTQLRPLGIGEILDVAIKTFSRNARTLITIGAIVGVPLELLNGLVQLSTVSSPDQVAGSFSVGNSDTSASFSRARGAGLVVSLLIGLIITVLLTAASVKAVSDGYLGGRPSVRDSLRFAVRRMRSLAWLYVLFGVGLLLATIALVIPGIWLYVAWSVATPVLLIEDVRGTAALRRSFRLVRHRWWPTAGLLLVAAFIVGITGGVFAGLLVLVPKLIDGNSVLLAVVSSTVSAALTAALVQPLQAAITTVLYFDLRVRHDGFDLTLLAARLGLPIPDAPLYAPPPGRIGSEDGVRDASGSGADQPPFWPPPPGWKPAAVGPAALGGEPPATGSGPSGPAPE